MATFIVGGALALLVAAILRMMWKERKKAKGCRGCCAQCHGCHRD